MKTHLFFLGMFLTTFSIPAFSQGFQPLRIVGAAGGTLTGSDGSTLGFTVGEVATLVLNNDSQLRQGFWQSFEVLIPVIEVDGTKAEITVFPNPFEDVLSLRINGSLTQAIDILLFDLNGRLLFEEKALSAGSIEIGGSSALPPGTYLLSLRDERGLPVGTEKVVKIQ